MDVNAKTLATLALGSEGDDSAFSQTELMELAGGYRRPESQGAAYEEAGFDDLTVLFPELFASSNVPGSLNDFEAMDVLRAVEERGRRPEDIAVIKDAVRLNHESWTLPALFRFEQFLRHTHITPHGTVFAKEATQGEIVKILLPSVDDLISGRVPLFAFSRAIKDIRDRWFGGDIELMGKHNEKTVKTLSVYAAGGLPASYDELYRLGSSLRFVDVDGLANAWFADKYVRMKAVDNEDFEEAPNLPFERKRMEILSFSADLKLGKAYKYDPMRSVHADMAGRIFHAIKAGFDVRTAVETYAEYAAGKKRFLDNSVGAAKKLVLEGELFAASFVRQMAAHLYRKQGDYTKAAVLTAQAGDALIMVKKYPKEFKNGGPSGDPLNYARQMRAELYRQALLDDAKGRAAKGLPIGPNVDYPFKKEMLQKFAEMKEPYSDDLSSELFSDKSQASRGEEVRKPVVVLRRKNGEKSGSGSASGSGGAGEVESEGAVVYPARETANADAHEAKAAFGDTVIANPKATWRPSWLPSCQGRGSPWRISKKSSPGAWKDIVDAGAVDLVIRAINAATGGLGKAASPIVFGAALMKLADRAGLFDVYFIDEGEKKGFGPQDYGQRLYLSAPVATPKVGN